MKRPACILKHGRPFMAPDPAVFPMGQTYSLSVPRQRMTDYFKSSLDVKSPIDRPTGMSIDSTRNPLRLLPIATKVGNPGHFAGQQSNTYVLQNLVRALASRWSWLQVSMIIWTNGFGRQIITYISHFTELNPI
ncbi:hypothetical protein JB92DRAFT_1958507 [Gautieria morchelliformis]|nr:hypothetical protein JB92DRAFT_1958507 [Gautieria morchelliformis]